MSQIYHWLNLYKKEKLVNIWDYDKLWGSCYTTSKEHCALLTLLADRWKGDLVIRLGCEGLDVPDDGRPVIAEIEGYGDLDDFSYEESIDVTWLFEEAQGCLRDVYDERGFFRSEPYTGPFELRFERFRYVVNTERRQFYDRERTAVQFVHDGRVARDDLFSVLCVSYGHECLKGAERLGSWFGELLEATNERPGEGYEDITAIHSDYGMPTDLTDEEILAHVSAGAPDYEADSDGWAKYANRRLDELLGRVRL